jgi:protein XagA
VRRVIDSARRVGVALSLCVCAIAGASPRALAGAWTLPQGSGLMIDTLYGWSGTGAPWGGGKGVPQTRFDAQLYAEYGLTEDWTIFGQTAFEHYALGRPTPNVYNGLDYSSIGLRRKLWASGEWVFSGEAILELPGATNPSAPAQEGNTGGAGEGRLLVGANFTLGPLPGFIDAQFGYRLRTAGPPDEWHGDLTVGFKPAPGWILMFQEFGVISAVSNNPSFPAWRQCVVQASLVIPIVGPWSLQAGVFTSVWTVKTNTERGALLSVWRTF